MNPEDVFTCRRAAGVFGLSEKHLRLVLRRRAAEGDPWPMKVEGTWMAPVFWWTAVVGEHMGAREASRSTAAPR